MIHKTENIINLETNEPFLIFSFDETSQQLSANNVKVWSLTKPQMAKNTEKVKYNSCRFLFINTMKVKTI